MRRWMVVALCGLADVGCADLTCGTGTHERDGNCVPNIETRCGPDTHWELGYCVVDRPDASDASGSLSDGDGA